MNPVAVLVASDAYLTMRLDRVVANLVRSRAKNWSSLDTLVIALLLPKCESFKRFRIPRSVRYSISGNDERAAEAAKSQSLLPRYLLPDSDAFGPTSATPLEYRISPATACRATAWATFRLSSSSPTSIARAIVRRLVVANCSSALIP